MDGMSAECALQSIEKTMATIVRIMRRIANGFLVVGHGIWRCSIVGCFPWWEAFRSWRCMRRGCRRGGAVEKIRCGGDGAKEKMEP
jgi:hypothetical protein